MGKARTQHNDQRRTNWIIGRGVDRSRLEAEIAKWAGVTPVPSLDEIIRVLALAWSPATQDVLRVLLEASQNQPGRAGFASAIRSARRVYRDIWTLPQPNKGGRKPETERNRKLWIAFEVAFAKAQATNPRTLMSLVKR